MRRRRSGEGDRALRERVDAAVATARRCGRASRRGDPRRARCDLGRRRRPRSETHRLAHARSIDSARNDVSSRVLAALSNERSVAAPIRSARGSSRARSPSARAQLGDATDAERWRVGERLRARRDGPRPVDVGARSSSVQRRPAPLDAVRCAPRRGVRAPGPVRHESSRPSIVKVARACTSISAPERAARRARRRRRRRRAERARHRRGAPSRRAATSARRRRS